MAVGTFNMERVEELGALIGAVIISAGRGGIAVAFVRDKEAALFVIH